MQALELAKATLEIPSVTPVDGGCQELYREKLAAAGFTIVDCSTGPVTNTFAYFGDPSRYVKGVNKSVVLNGHTDVVPASAEDGWATPPFAGTERDGFLWARGACDMKVTNAEMIGDPGGGGVLGYLADHPEFAESGDLVAFIFTSHEEATTGHPDLNENDGTSYVVDQILKMGYPVDGAIVGEPTSEQVLGDAIKCGRRGMDQVMLTVRGEAGHTGYVPPGRNALMVGSAAVAAFLRPAWQPSKDGFPDTTLNFTILEGNGSATTVPGEVTFVGDCRFAPPYSGTTVSKEIDRIIAAAIADYLGPLGLADQASYSIIHKIHGEPFATPPDSELALALRTAITDVLKMDPVISTKGGISDARHLANKLGVPTVEFGHLNATIHRPNERIPLSDIGGVARVTQRLLERYFAEPTT